MAEHEPNLGAQLVQKMRELEALNKSHSEEVAEIKIEIKALMRQIESAQTMFDFATAQRIMQQPEVRA